jgi:hypothetical protein
MKSSTDRGSTYLPYLWIFEPETEDMYPSLDSDPERPNIRKTRNFQTVTDL